MFHNDNSKQVTSSYSPPGAVHNVFFSMQYKHAIAASRLTDDFKSLQVTTLAFNILQNQKRKKRICLLERLFGCNQPLHTRILSQKTTAKTFFLVIEVKNAKLHTIFKENCTSPNYQGERKTQPEITNPKCDTPRKTRSGYRK